MNTEPTRVLKRPIITEKTTRLKEIKNRVVFAVDREATKPAIKEAVEKAFKVKVMDVHTMIVRGKIKKMGRFMGKRSNWKKAIVTLKEGDKIDLFEGV